MFHYNVDTPVLQCRSVYKEDPNTRSGEEDNNNNSLPALSFVVDDAQRPAAAATHQVKGRPMNDEVNDNSPRKRSKFGEENPEHSLNS